ncbi:ATP-dependent RecD-like DNA helicase [Brevibacillus thermoruber]|uniref:ATP-dependent RecD2 DNA helicase n=1 Tax=Brevibacillus thermoruber TaxID=33942 RepID=A0A9X3TTL0_9BACL|nr:ATP-dependent RecD-like DNA helicase [Brevibacillus thermoruber]MDA5110871.1 ATP-dependent RecD-like DNA helicase [Brevibacillus thermoruber]
MDGITGTLVRYKYRQPNNDFIVAILKQDDSKEITIIGSIYGVEPNEKITVYGDWFKHPQFGDQYRVERWERPIPKSKEQVIAFLSSSLVKGCGEKRAKQIVDVLGENALDIIMQEGEACLLPIRGIGQQKASSIVTSVRSSFEVQQIMMELSKYGISTSIVVKAYKEFGSNTLDIIKRNPYQLTKLDLIGFLKADEIAKRMGIMPNSMFRIESCVDYMLKKMCFDFGHCFIPEAELIDEVLKVLNHNTDVFITRDEVEQGIFQLEENGRVIIEEGGIYPPFLYRSEKRLAQRLLKFMRSGSNNVNMSAIDTAIKEYQIRSKIVLAKGQREAIRKLFTENLLILTGGPGCGKTASVKAVIDVYQRLNPVARIALAAPTGRASRKLTEVTGLDAATIHRLINFRPGEEPEFNESNPLEADLLIVDEISMMDIQLADLLFRAINPNKTKVLLVGDQDQLPSVNPGNVLKDMLDAGVPHVRLTEVFRQAQNSQIVTNAHRINKGESIVIDPVKQDFYFIQREKPEEIATTIRNSVVRFTQLGYTAADILVLSPMKKGPIGTEELNRVLQETLNPPAPHKDEIAVGKTIFRVGDKILQTKNNYAKEVFNGDIGTIDRIDYLLDKEGQVTEEKGLYCKINGQVVTYTKEELHELQLAYSITIHKSQGGQAPIVIIPVSTSHYIMLARNLIYTGITRAESKVVLVGTKKAVQIAIKNNKIVARHTRLTKRIVEDIQLYGLNKTSLNPPEWEERRAVDFF